MPTLEEITRISIEELKGLMDQGDNMVIVDNNPKSLYEESHIKGPFLFHGPCQELLGRCKKTPQR